MKVKVLFFGATADAAGARSVEIDLPGGMRSSEVFAKVLAERPGLAVHRLLYSVNQEYSAGDEVLNEGDELAIFTAVSGG